MAIELDGLVVAQGGFRLTATVAFAANAVTALIGPSGEGKSTLLAAIAGFLIPSAGTIRIDGNDQSGVPPGQRPVTMLFQDHNLFPHLNVTGNVGLGLRPELRLSKIDAAIVANVLVEVGLAGFGARLPGTLSGGQSSRVALARALLRNKPVLLLDEPFAAMGPALRHEMLDLITAVQSKNRLTVLMVTHAPDDARRIARYSSCIAEGSVQQPVLTGALLDDPPAALRSYLG